MLKLGKPLRVGRHVLRNRLVMAPMERNYCDSDGNLTESYLAYLEARARGSAGLVYVEAAYVSQEGKSRRYQMGLSRDSHVAGTRDLARRVHRQGSLLGIQLMHGGRTSPGRVSGMHPVAPSPGLPSVNGAEVPEALTPEQIERIIGDFARAASRAERAGADVIALHAAHGYLLHSFMSPATNRRGDIYGDPTVVLTRIIEETRAAAPNVALGLRISAFEGTPDGLTAEGQFEILRRTGAADLDFIEVSVGNYESPELIVQTGETPRGFLAAYAKRYREFGVPVGVVGRIVDGGTAEEMISRQCADYVMAARAFHADERFAETVLSGSEPRPCIACNLCSDDLGSGPIRCSVNPWLPGEEPSLLPNTTGRVNIVGSGPSGLQAASLLAEAGCDVTLFEQDTAIGGQFRLASRLAGVPEYVRSLDYFERRLRRANVAVRLGRRVSVPSKELADADVLILATGAVDRKVEFEGRAAQMAVGIRSWLKSGDVSGAEHVTIIGGDREALAVAYDLMRRGTRVTVICREEQIGLDVGRRAKIRTLPAVLESPLVRIHTNAAVVRMDEGEILIRDPEGARVVPSPGPVLVTMGSERDDELQRNGVDAGRQPLLVAPPLDAPPSDSYLDAILSGTALARRAVQLLRPAYPPTNTLLSPMTKESIS